MKVVYQGMSEAGRKRNMDAFVARLDPTGIANGGDQYLIEKNDHPIIVQRKMEATKTWKDERIAEHAAELNAIDAEKVIEGLSFPKGKIVDVPEEHRANRMVNPNGDLVDGPLHGHIKAKIFKIVDEAGEEVQQKPAAKIEQRQPGKKP